MQGNYGMDVELLQNMLGELGYTVEPAGYFDQATTAALASFQRDAGLAENGIFDDLTWIELREALDRVSQDQDPQLQKAIELTRKPELWGQLGR